MTDEENKKTECPYPGQSGKGKCDGYQVFHYQGRSRCVWTMDDGSCKLLSCSARMVGSDRGFIEQQKKMQAGEANG